MNYWYESASQANAGFWFPALISAGSRQCYYACSLFLRSFFMLYRKKSIFMFLMDYLVKRQHRVQPRNSFQERDGGRKEASDCQWFPSIQT